VPVPDALLDAGVSVREAEVLELVADGATNAEVAAHLYVSVRTVESHVSSLLRKLGVPDRRALARQARAARGEPVAPPVSGRAIPVPLTSFVGRAAEIAELREAVRSHRLVTATGPGGVGKTRLAAAVAADLASELRDGAWFVDLVPVADDERVPDAVRTTLGLAEPQRRSVEDMVLSHLAPREALLVLDNCEHLADGVGVFVERLLGRAARVRVLATSQARLMVPFERVFPVPGLSLPPGAGEGETTGDGPMDDPGDAVSLFVERARQAGAADVGAGAADVARIAEICRRLDGSALAIELAAARLPVLGLDGIERSLDERLRLLAGGSRVDERHRSLASTIDWSYRLLTPGEQALLRRLSVFAAPFTLAAAQPVAGFPPVEPGAITEGLARLAEHSLVLVSPGAETRYRVLESIRQYGRERMTSGASSGGGAGAVATDGAAGCGADAVADAGADELAMVRHRHLGWAIGNIRDLDERVDLPLGDALQRPDELAAWRDDVDRVLDDTRAALKWSSGRPDLRDEAEELARLLGSVCFGRGLLGESQERYEQAAALAPDGRRAAEMRMFAAGAAASRGAGNEALRLWRAAADAAVSHGDAATAAYALARSAELLLRGPGIIPDLPSGDAHLALIAEAREVAPDDPRAEAAILTALTFDADDDDGRGTAPEVSTTPEMVERAVSAAREQGDPLLTSAALDAATAHALAAGDVGAAVAAVTERIAILSEVRPSALAAFEIGDGYNMATEVALTAGDFATARRYADVEARLPFHSVEGHLATSRRMRVDALIGRFDRVLEDAQRFRTGWEQAGHPVATSLASGAYIAAAVHALRGDDEARAEWVDIALQMGVDKKRLAGCSTGYVPTFDAIVALHRGDAGDAVARLAEDPRDFRRWYTGEWRPWYAALHAEAAVLAGLPDAAERTGHARALAAANPTAAAMVERAAVLLEGDRSRLVEIAEILAGTGCLYQQARTLVLAGDDAAAEGRRLMAELGAAPMAEPAPA
jgi:predicted ATPase/DNA-binding CsgD family transcriptional regulator